MRKTVARRSSWSRVSSPSVSCPRKSEKLPRGLTRLDVPELDRVEFANS